MYVIGNSNYLYLSGTFLKVGEGLTLSKKKIKTEKTPFQISTIMSIMGRGGGLLAGTYISIFNFIVNSFFFLLPLFYIKSGGNSIIIFFFIYYFEKRVCCKKKWGPGLPLSLILRACLLNAYTKSPHRPQMTYWQSQITISHWNFCWNTRT